MLNWEQDPKRTERGIQMLLCRLHPGLQSLDGAGGDGGRDAQLVAADGRTVFEIKSFGRLTSSRRRQAERSLRAAVASAQDMTRWVLVIPMNRTPERPGVRSGEETWFKVDLQKLAPDVELEWRGLDWLDAQVAESMDIQRYIEGTDGQLLQRAREFEMEKAVLAGGADDLRTRLGNLHRTVNEISPFWTLDFSLRDGVQETWLRAKVPDAHIVDPIRIVPTVTFRSGDPDDEALLLRFEQTLAFGGSVELPAGYVTSFDVEASEEARRLFPTGDPRDSEFTIVSPRVPLERPLRCSYQVRDDQDRNLAQFHVYLRERSSGARGVTLYGSDAAGIASFEVGIPTPSRVPQPDASVTEEGARLHIDLVEDIVGFDIADLLPVARTLAAANPGTRLRFDMPGLGFVGGGEPLVMDAFPDAASTCQIVEDLHRMEELTGSVLRFPADITNGHAADLRGAVRQLDGEIVEREGGLTLNVRPEAVGEFLESWKNSPTVSEQGGFVAATEAMELESW